MLQTTNQSKMTRCFEGHGDVWPLEKATMKGLRAFGPIRLRSSQIDPPLAGDISMVASLPGRFLWAHRFMEVPYRIIQIMLINPRPSLVKAGWQILQFQHVVISWNRANTTYHPCLFGIFHEINQPVWKSPIYGNLQSLHLQVISPTKKTCLTYTSLSRPGWFPDPNLGILPQNHPMWESTSITKNGGFLSHRGTPKSS